MPVGRPRQPIELIVNKGKKHLTKDEIERRRAEEVKVPDGDIIAPGYLTKKQRAEFDTIAKTLIESKIMKSLDVDALASYLINRDEWLAVVRLLKSRRIREDVDQYDKYSRIEDRYRKQMRLAASDLGLTISSRCKLIMPTIEQPVPHDNKFAKFSAVSGNG